MDCRGELKLFGCAIPLYRERSGEKDIVAEEEEATMEGICIEEAAAAAIHTQDGSGGKMQKEGVSAGTQVQPSHLLVLLPQPDDDDDDGEEEEEEIPTTGGAAIISGNDDNNDNNNNNDDHNDNGSNSNSNKDNHKVMKPEKILPCPRCKSLNTKFCYFNNGNANQPRHFCRGCQRYWTAGGALRNIPVGSGRRKSKLSSSGSSSSSTSHPPPHHYPPCPFVNWTDGALVRSDMADSAQHLLPPQSAVLPTAAKGRRLQMGCSIQDSRKPSKSSSSNGLMATEDGIAMMMPLDEQSAANGGTTTTTTNVSNEWNGSSSGGGAGETYPPIDECACSSSKQQPSTIVGGSGGGYMGNSPPFGFLMQPSPFGYGFFGFSPMLNLNQSSSSTPLAGWCAPPPSMGGGRGVFPWPLMPAFPPWLPWAITPPPIVGGGFTPPCSSSSLLALGKHPREGLSQHTVSGKDGCPLTLKTLRTREPQEAAQSTIWSSLGLDNNHSHNDNHKNNNSVSAFGIFKGFPAKTKEKDGADETQEPHVNPAARTRSIGFHENI